MFHRPHSPSIGAGVVPPAGGAVGINMRLTLGYPSAGRTDGDIDVWVGGQQSGDMNYPSTYQNLNGDSLTCGFLEGFNLNNYNANWDVRLVGANVSPITWIRYRFDLPTAGMYRFWLGIGIHVPTTANFQLWDGDADTGILRDSFNFDLTANEFTNANGVIRSQAGWISNYDADYIDAQIDAGHAVIRAGRYWDHVRVLQL